MHANNFANSGSFYARTVNQIKSSKEYSIHVLPEATKNWWDFSLANCLRSRLAEESLVNLLNSQ